MIVHKDRNSRDTNLCLGSAPVRGRILERLQSAHLRSRRGQMMCRKKRREIRQPEIEPLISCQRRRLSRPARCPDLTSRIFLTEVIRSE